MTERRTIFSGRLGEGFFFPDLIRRIHLECLSGELLLEKKDRKKKVFFEEGRIVYCATTVRTERVGVFLIREGKISSEDLAKAIVAKGRDKRLGSTLVEMGFIGEDDLIDALSRCVQENTFELFHWPSAGYSFVTPATPLPEDLRFSFSTPDMILEGIRRLKDEQIVEQGLGEMDRILRMAEKPLKADQMKTLKPTEGFLLSRVDGHLTAKEICRISTEDRFTTIRCLYGLLCVGIIEYEEDKTPDEEPVIILDEESRDGEQDGGRTVDAGGTSDVSEPAEESGGGDPELVFVTTSGETLGDRPKSAPAGNAAPGAGRPASAGSGIYSGLHSGDGVGGREDVRAPRGDTGGGPSVIIESTAPPAPEKQAEDEADDSGERNTIISKHKLCCQDEVDYYQVLEVTREADDQQIRQAYYRLAKQFHPDRARAKNLGDLDDKLELLFMKIGEAYETLSSRDKRKDYDDTLSRAPLSKKRMTDLKKESGRREMAEVHFREGMKYYQDEDYYNAVQLFTEAVRANDQNAEYYRFLGMALSKNPKWRKRAEQNFLEAAKLDPYNVDTQMLLGHLYIDCGLSHRAASRFEEALRLDPHNDVARRELDLLKKDKGTFIKSLFRKKN